MISLDHPKAMPVQCSKGCNGRDTRTGFSKWLRDVFSAIFLCMLLTIPVVFAQELDLGPVSEPLAAADLETPTTTVFAESTVGMPVTIRDVILPGKALVAKPILDRHQPFILRVINTYKHGTDHRYDLEFYGLEPGEYNLIDYLTSSDDSVVEGAPQLWVRISSSFPEGQIVPSDPSGSTLPRFGGYRVLVVLGAIIWIFVLAVLIWGGKRSPATPSIASNSKVTLAERLTLLVRSAREGTLDENGYAELERLLIAFWCRKLGFDDLPPGMAIQRLKEHSEAGPFLRGLESWLHQPQSTTKIDIKQFLEPYANVRDEMLAASTSTRTHKGVT